MLKPLAIDKAQVLALSGGESEARGFRVSGTGFANQDFGHILLGWGEGVCRGLGSGFKFRNIAKRLL